MHGQQLSCLVVILDLLLSPITSPKLTVAQVFYAEDESNVMVALLPDLGLYSECVECRHSRQNPNTCRPILI